MATTRKPYNPNLLTLDDGRTFDTSRMSGLDVKGLGETQEQLRRNAETNRDFDTGIWMQRAQNVLPMMPGYFGVLQGKENAARGQGYGFGVDFAGKGPGTGTGFGTWKGQTDGGPSFSLETGRMPSTSRSSLRALGHVTGAGGSHSSSDTMALNEELSQQHAQHWLNQAMIRDATARASMAEDQALDSTFADDPYAMRQRATNVAEGNTILGRAQGALQREQVLPNVRAQVGAVREGEAARRLFPDFRAAQDRPFEQQKELGSMRSLLGIIQGAYSKDPLGAGEGLETLLQNPLFRGMGGGAPSGGRGGFGTPTQPLLDTGRGDIDLDNPTGVSDLMDRSGGAPLATNDLLDRISSDLQQAGIEPTPENIARAYQMQIRKLSGGLQ